MWHDSGVIFIHTMYLCMGTVQYCTCDYKCIVHVHTFIYVLMAMAARFRVLGVHSAKLMKGMGVCYEKVRATS